MAKYSDNEFVVGQLLRFYQFILRVTSYLVCRSVKHFGRLFVKTNLSQSPLPRPIDIFIPLRWEN